MAYMSPNTNNTNDNQIEIINNNSLEKDIGFILWENKFANYLNMNIKDYLNYYNEIKNPLNKFVSVDQNYYDLIKNNFIKTIVLITNLSIYCTNLRLKIKEIFFDNILIIKNLFQNNDKNKDKKEDKFISFANKNVLLLIEMINTKIN